jgi:hypothetical protein
VQPLGVTSYTAVLLYIVMNTLAYDLTFEQEINYLKENRAESLRTVLDTYRNTVDETGINLYQWEEIQFANTKIVSRTADYFTKYGIYCPYDPGRETRQFKEWWDREEFRRTHGVVLPIKSPPGGGLSDKDLLPLWVPGKMYGQLNFGPIVRKKREEDLSVETTLERQKDQLAAAGSEKEKQLDLIFTELATKKTGQIAYSFPDFWDGHYHTWVAFYVSIRLGLNIIVFKARRKGFSYINGWDTADDYDLIPNSTTLLIAYELKYLNVGDGLFNMAVRYLDFINKHTDWYKNRLIDNKDIIKSGFNYKGLEGDYGYLSSILALSAMDNPDCARGKLATKVKYEECGRFPNLDETRNTTESAAESGDYSIGQSSFWGTASSKNEDIAAFTRMCYNPSASDCMAFNNIWSHNKRNTQFAMFFGHHQNYDGAIDIHGNSDIEKAKQLHALRSEKKKEKSTMADFAAWKAERCTIPEEGLSTINDNIFSMYSAEISDRIEMLEKNPYLGNFGRNGKYKQVGDQVILITNEELQAKGEEWHPPLFDANPFLPKGYDMHGCITEWHSPFTIRQRDPHTGVYYESVPPGLYMIWHDPYATDKDAAEIEMKSSVGSAYVFERPNIHTPYKGFRLVASWNGRPPTVDAYNRQLFLLARRYNTISAEGVGRLMFENDRGNVYADAKAWKEIRWLMPEPESLALRELSGTTGRRYGVSIGKNARRKSAGLLAFRDLLGTPVSKNNETGEQTLFVETINCRRLLRETKIFKSKGNFDTVSAGVVGTFGLDDLHFQETGELYDAVTYDDNSDFWNRFK